MLKRKEKLTVKASPKVFVHYEGKDPERDEPDEIIEMKEREISVSPEQMEKLSKIKEKSYGYDRRRSH